MDFGAVTQVSLSLAGSDSHKQKILNAFRLKDAINVEIQVRKNCGFAVGFVQTLSKERQ